MRLKYLFFIFLLVVPFLMLNCQNNSVPAIEIVAKAGNQYLTRDELLNWMPQDIPEEHSLCFPVPQHSDTHAEEPRESDPAT